MNSYLKSASFVGIPLLFFSAIFFYFLVGTWKGLIGGIIIGIFLGVIPSLMLGFILSEPVKEMYHDLKKEYEYRPKKLSNLIPAIFILIITFVAAFYAKQTGQITIPLILTILINVFTYIVFALASGIFRKALTERNLFAQACGILTIVSPSALLYFIALFLFFRY